MHTRQMTAHAQELQNERAHSFRSPCACRGRTDPGGVRAGETTARAQEPQDEHASSSCCSCARACGRDVSGGEEVSGRQLGGSGWRGDGGGLQTRETATHARNPQNEHAMYSFCGFRACCGRWHSLRRGRVHAWARESLQACVHAVGVGTAWGMSGCTRGARACRLVLCLCAIVVLHVR
jgi:hypothetical protein